MSTQEATAPKPSDKPKRSCCFNFIIWGLRGYRLYLKWCIIIFWTFLIIMSLNRTMLKDFLTTNKCFYERSPTLTELWLKQQAEWSTSLGGIMLMFVSVVSSHRPTRLLSIFLEMVRIGLLTLGGPGQVLLNVDPKLNEVVNRAFAHDVQFLMYTVLFGVSCLAFLLELFFYKFDPANEREPGFFDFLWEDETLGGDKLTDKNGEKEKDDKKTKVE